MLSYSELYRVCRERLYQLKPILVPLVGIPSGLHDTVEQRLCGILAVGHQHAVQTVVCVIDLCPCRVEVGFSPTTAAGSTRQRLPFSPAGV
jgi:hypothetical protein